MECVSVRDDGGASMWQAWLFGSPYEYWPLPQKWYPGGLFECIKG